MKDENDGPFEGTKFHDGAAIVETGLMSARSVPVFVAKHGIQRYRPLGRKVFYLGADLNRALRSAAAEGAVKLPSTGIVGARLEERGGRAQRRGARAVARLADDAAPASSAPGAA